VLGAEVDSGFPDTTFASKDWGTWRAEQIRDAMYGIYAASGRIW
jgi:hypothetical protein